MVLGKASSSQQKPPQVNVMKQKRDLWVPAVCRSLPSGVLLCGGDGNYKCHFTYPWSLETLMHLMFWILFFFFFFLREIEWGRKGNRFFLPLICQHLSLIKSLHSSNATVLLQRKPVLFLLFGEL